MDDIKRIAIIIEVAVHFDQAGDIQCGGIVADLADGVRYIFDGFVGVVGANNVAEQPNQPAAKVAGQQTALLCALDGFSSFIFIGIIKGVFGVDGRQLEIVVFQHPAHLPALFRGKGNLYAVLIYVSSSEIDASAAGFLCKTDGFFEIQILRQLIRRKTEFHAIASC